MAVKFRIGETKLTIARSGSGDLAVTSDRPDNVGKAMLVLATQFMHDKVMIRGWTLCDELRVAQAIVKEFKGEIIDCEALKKSIRLSWSKLLKANLIPDALQVYSARKDALITPWYLSVSVQAGARYVVHTGGPIYRAIYHIHDPDHLVVYRLHKPRPWRARWERIREITFEYLEPPPSRHKVSHKGRRITPPSAPSS